MVDAVDPQRGRGRLSSLRLCGDVDRDVAALLIEQLAQLEAADSPVTIDLAEADVDDAKVVAMMVDALRACATRLGKLTIIGAPQVVAHTLYRTNALTNIELIEPREELGTSS